MPADASTATDNQMFNPKIHTTDVTPAFDTDGAEGVSGHAWYVLWVRPRAEKAARDRLLAAGFEAYVTTRQEIHLWRSKDMRHKEKKERRMVEVVLIPSVVFVGIRAGEANKNKIRDDILAIPGAMAFMHDPALKRPGATFWETIARVSAREMHLMRAMLEQSDFEVGFTNADFQIGDKVRILDFGNGNETAQIVKLFGNNNSYVGLRVSFLGCAYMKVTPEMLVKLSD